MVDPLNPRLDNEGLLEQISKQYPNLTREEIIELAEAFGFDLTPSPSDQKQDEQR